MIDDNDSPVGSAAEAPPSPEQRQERQGPLLPQEQLPSVTPGQRLAEHLRATREPFLRTLESRQLSQDYLLQAEDLIEEYADFCDGQEDANPWLLRQRYLAQRAHRPRRYRVRMASNKEHCWSMRTQGYGFVLTHRAQIVTRRHLIWLEQQGNLPPGTAAQAQSTLGARAITVVEETSRPTSNHGEREADALLTHFVVRVDPHLPQPLRQPLNEYLAQLVHERQLVQHSIQAILRASLALCRTLAVGGETFAYLRVRHLDQVVASLVSAPQHDLLRRRRQVQALHSQLRGFLRYLYRRGLVDRDLAPALISPPCYRASRPPTMLSPPEVQALLESVDRQGLGGRRRYAILLLFTTYGLRPIDVSRLRLDDLQWREQRLALVQKKTGQVVVLPLLPEVATALYDYLRYERAPDLLDRRVFASLKWPHRPVCARTISDIVVQAMQEASLSGGRTKHLRPSVATHLLRQGEAFSTIQEVLGHRTAETTQRYAVTDVELLRQVIEETER